MTSILAALLYKEERPDVPNTGSGRRIFFDKAQPNITLVTGSICDRIEAYLREIAESATVTEIAHGIGSNSSRVAAAIKRLRVQERVDTIKVDGCVAEYVLKE